jgi:hypothetical protein
MDKSGQEFAALAASCRGIDILQFCILPTYFDFVSGRKWISLHLTIYFNLYTMKHYPSAQYGV